MNTFNITRLKDADRQPDGPGSVEIHLSCVADNSLLGEQVRAAFEIEIMQGSRTDDGAGGSRYHFEVDDEKGELLCQWLTAAYFQMSDN